MDVQLSARRRTLATLAAAVIACAGITVATAAPASAGEPGHCEEFNTENYGPCGVVYNEGAVQIGIFNNWDRPVPGYPGTDNYSQYAQSHPQTAAVIWDYWSKYKDKDGAKATLLPIRTNSQSFGPDFHDTDGFYLGPGMRALVDIGPFSSCVVGPIYYKVHGGVTANVLSGPGVC
ncbi:MAG: hypothetical protein ACRDSP_00245 [Pseudonocardiaceae bacterium]